MPAQHRRVVVVGNAAREGAELKSRAYYAMALAVMNGVHYKLSMREMISLKTNSVGVVLPIHRFGRDIKFVLKELASHDTA